MKSYDAMATIAASSDVVWSILTDRARYAEWDSGVERVEGSIASGGTIKVFSRDAPDKAFPVKVAEFAPSRRMIWEGGLPLGLFKVVWSFTLTPQDGGITLFTMREVFSGPLLPLIWRSMPDIGPSFQQFARGLKAEAERQG